MKVLYLEWNSYCNEDMKEGLKKEGHEVEVCPFFEGIRVKQETAEKILIPKLEKNKYDFVFSFNYMPVVSNICKEYECAYVSWVYDSPYIHVYSYTVLNSCNYIFLFDYALYQELYSAGIQTVYYLPLAVNPDRVLKLNNTAAKQREFEADVSFVGSLYNEPKNRLYDKFADVNSYTKGYLDAIIEAQKKVRVMTLDQREKIISIIRKKVHENAEILANMGVNETGMGNVGDKILKHQLTAEKTPGKANLFRCFGLFSY